jgi:SAM-dependent methyltransferase
MARASRIQPWPEPFDPAAELDWGDPTFSRRLLREHLDQEHDGASRRERTVTAHVRRLRALLPHPPARLLDAACGPGLYAVRLAGLGYDVDGVDVGPAVIRHARKLAVAAGVSGRARFTVGDLVAGGLESGYDGALLIYHVLESFPRATQRHVLRALGAALGPTGRLVVEMRLHPDQPPGRISAWDVVDRSLLSDRRHLLLTDTVWEPRTATYVLRETAVFDDGTTAVQQTTGRLTAFEAIPRLFEGAGLRVLATYDGWTRHPANALCDSILVVAGPISSAPRRRRPPG